MSFDRISFSHFYLEVKNIMDPKWFKVLNPEVQSFWKSDSCYYALTIGNSEIYVIMLQGKDKNNIAGMRALIKEAKLNNINTLRFGTYSKNKKMLSLFKYIEASYVRTIKSYFEDDDLVEYTLNISESSRFNS